MTRDDLIEALAAVEHQRWADWQKYLHGQGEREPVQMVQPDGSWVMGDDLILSAPLVERWERQILTSYADLSEREKASDREQVARYWPLIVAFVGGWLSHIPVEDDNGECVDLAERWREEMM